MEVALALEGVSKRFVIHHEKARSFQDTLVNFFQRRNGTTEEFWALRDVTFSVAEGETLALIGRNGSGKSTILKLITRILKPSTGTITVRGRVSALVELGAGFHPDLTGRENIYLNGSIMGFSRQEMASKFDEIVDFAEMGRFIDTAVKHYSSGMYARLGFAVAVSVDPEILIIDEVLSVGDEHFKNKCLVRIQDFKSRGKTILFVSHAMETVTSLCDRAVWLDGGHVLADGPVRSVVDGYLSSMGCQVGPLHAESVTAPLVT
ncbi:MAG: ABC transporter ATP-binding protein [Chloroflexota bacterium]